jgi:hypothetical protein
VVVANRISHILFLNKLRDKQFLWPRSCDTSSKAIRVRYLREVETGYGIITRLRLQASKKETGAVRNTFFKSKN